MAPCRLSIQRTPNRIPWAEASWSPGFTLQLLQVACGPRHSKPGVFVSVWGLVQALGLAPHEKLDVCEELRILLMLLGFKYCSAVSFQANTFQSAERFQFPIWLGETGARSTCQLKKLPMDSPSGRAQHSWPHFNHAESHPHIWPPARSQLSYGWFSASGPGVWSKAQKHSGEVWFWASYPKVKPSRICERNQAYRAS